MAVGRFTDYRQNISVSLVSGVVSATFDTHGLVPAMVYVPSGAECTDITGWLEFRAYSPAGTTFQRTFNSSGTTFQVALYTGAANQVTLDPNDWKGPRQWRVTVEDVSYTAVTQAGATFTIEVMLVPAGHA